MAGKGGVNIRNPKEYMENLLVIRTKEQKLVRFKMKPVQARLYEIIKEEHAANRPVRLVVLKARQEGVSTEAEGLMFQDTATRKMVNTLIIAHREDATTNLFNMNKLFYDYLPPRYQPMRKHSNAKALVFENPTKNKAEKRRRPGLRSRIRCVTAGSGGAGRSDTLTNVHMSEMAFWTGDPMATYLGIMQSVPDSPDTCVIVESTANGMNFFKEFWDNAVSGKNGYRPVFFPWFDEPEYRRPVAQGTEWTEKELRLKEAYQLDFEQLAWRRWCVATNCNGDENLFCQEYPSHPDEAFLFTGDPYFNNEALMALRSAAPQPIRTGEFVFTTEGKGGVPQDIQWADKPGGMIRIYADPQPGVPYVLGGDTAGEGSDCFTAWVIDNRTGRQVAELQYPFSEILYARMVWCLGRYYNWALAGIEVNFSTYPEMKLEEWNYPHLYQRERFDTFTGKMVKAFGWATTSKTRPVMLAGLHTLTEESPELIASFETLGEMLVFVYGKNRKPQALEGKHDDLVTAAAITHAIRDQQRFTAAHQQQGTAEWTPDMWEDYNGADPETRRYLLKKWGTPK